MYGRKSARKKKIKTIIGRVDCGETLRAMTNKPMQLYGEKTHQIAVTVAARFKEIDSICTKLENHKHPNKKTKRKQHKRNKEIVRGVTNRDSVRGLSNFTNKWKQRSETAPHQAFV